MIIDTHCHLGHDDYDNREEIINHFKDNIMIISGTDTKSSKEVVEIVNKYPNIYGSIGVHPEFAHLVKDEDYDILEQLLKNDKIVAVGEIGLDYHYDNYDKDKQRCVFMKQIELAKKYHKPIVIHTRDAIKDTYDIIKMTNANTVPITIHCFSESLEMAKEFIKLGCKLGIGGVLTFKNSKKLKEVVSNIDIENIVLETDSPYLAPEPVRGTKNEPKNVYYVAFKIAEIKQMDVQDVIKITTENAKKQYKIGS